MFRFLNLFRTVGALSAEMQRWKRLSMSPNRYLQFFWRHSDLPLQHSGIRPAPILEGIPSSAPPVCADSEEDRFAHNAKADEGGCRGDRESSHTGGGKGCGAQRGGKERKHDQGDALILIPDRLNSFRLEFL